MCSLYDGGGGGAVSSAVRIRIMVCSPIGIATANVEQVITPVQMHHAILQVHAPLVALALDLLVLANDYVVYFEN